MSSVYKRSVKGPWYASWNDHTGKRISKCTRTTDKATAERIAKKHEADAALPRDGVIDPALDSISRESLRTIDDHLSDYKSKLIIAGRTVGHIQRTINFVRKISSYAGFTTAADITADGVTRYAANLQQEGLSARTIQAHLTAIKSFTKWLTNLHKLPRDPLMSVKKPNPQADRRHERRMLLPEELQRLEYSTDHSSVKYGMEGKDRTLLYLTAIQSGLRANEIRSLEKGSLNLDSDAPYITCKPEATKNRQPARQYIQPELAARLKSHVSKKTRSAPVFNLPHESNLARMLREDLGEARMAWLIEAIDDKPEYAKREQSDFLVVTNHKGEILDFHSLRHTCGAWLVKAGANINVVQKVLRHQTITLTMDTYGHLFPGQEVGAVEQMRSMFSKAKGGALSASLSATGAIGGSDGVQRRMQQTQCETSQAAANGCEGETEVDAKKKSPKPLLVADLSDCLQENATGDVSSPGGTRNIALIPGV